MSDRKYPDIDFVETDTETIESNLTISIMTGTTTALVTAQAVQTMWAL